MTDIKTARHEKQLQVAAAVEQGTSPASTTSNTKKLNFNPLLRPEERDPDFNPFNQTVIKPNTFVLIRLPSENFRVVKMTPSASVNLGKFGSFRVHDILGHPFGYTYEIFGIGPEEKGLVKNQKIKKGLKKLSKEEKRKLYEQQRKEEEDAQKEREQEEAIPPPGPQLRIVQGLDTMEEGGASTKDELDPDENNKDLMYDPQAMKLTMAEIEALKRSSVDAGREVIFSMIKAHSSFDKKTTFSQEKYVKRKEQKFLRRFAPEPINTAEILNLYLEKDPHKVLDMSEETLGLLLSLGNVKPGGTYLVAEDTSGLLVAALLERMAGQGTIVVAHANEHTRMDALKYLSVSDAWIESKVKTINWLDFLHPEEHDMGLESEGEEGEEHKGKGGIDEEEKINTTTDNADTNKSSTTTTKSDSSYFLYKFVEKTPQEIAAMKPHQRGQYYRRKKRYDEFVEVRALIDSQAFDAAFLATELDLPTLAPRVVDSLKGSASLVIYSQFKENLVATSHVLQKDLRVLAPTLLETKVRKYQTLPGRMHPVMTMRGGGGYLLWGTRVIPTEVDAIGGSRGKKRKAVESSSSSSPKQQQQPENDTDKNDAKNEPSSKQIKLDKD